MDAETRAEFEKLFDGNERLTIDPSALERRFTIPERNRAIVREFRQVLDNGYRDHKGTLRKPLIGKTIVFAVNKRHAESLAGIFDEAFRDRKDSPEVRYADYVVSGMDQDDTLDGMSKIRRFKKEPFPKILVSVNMLDTGFDCPEVVNLVFTRFTRSSILYQQMRGRGTRKIPGKPSFTMFDFAGVCDYHGDADEIGEGGFVAETPKKKKYEARRLLALDVDDHIDPTTREWISVDENGNLVFPEVSEQKAAELGAKFEAWLLTRHDLTPTAESWLRVIGNQIRANADTLEEFTAGHFAFHPFNLMGGYPEAVRLFVGEDNLYALLFDLNEAVFRQTKPTQPQQANNRPALH
ncbi:MAG: helicase-related protein [Methylococcales bacterium]